MEILHTFRTIDGSWPQGQLIQGADGALYGTTHYGGETATGATTGSGTVFKITTNGVFTLLHDFMTGDQGRYPRGGLERGADGAYYGTTYRRLGAANIVVFRITPAGEFTPFSVLDLTNGSFADAGVVKGADDAFYGTATQVMGGYGTVYRVSPQGVAETLAVFQYTNGVSPRCKLLQVDDGSFYGAADGLASDQRGTIFNVTTNGELRTVIFFNGTNGGRPFGGLTKGNDGHLYGTTTEGGAHGAGTIYRLSSAEAFTTVFSFNRTNGATPIGNLLLANDGMMYGTTWAGGTSNLGTIFRLEPSSGNVETLAHFFGTNGSYPLVGLTQGSDGHLYGACQRGDAYNSGNVFRLVLPQLNAIALRVRYSGGNIMLSWPTNAADFILESAEKLGEATQWSPFGGLPTTVNDELVVPFAADRPYQFFRLKKP